MLFQEYLGFRGEGEDLILPFETMAAVQQEEFGFDARTSQRGIKTFGLIDGDEIVFPAVDDQERRGSGVDMEQRGGAACGAATAAEEPVDELVAVSALGDLFGVVLGEIGGTAQIDHT